MAEIVKLRDENARLRSSEAESVSALSTLRMIMRDDGQPANVRVRAATAVLACETPSLKPMEAPLDLVAEPIEDLATVVERQRARQRRMMALSLEERAALIPGCLIVELAIGHRHSTSDQFSFSTRLVSSST
jgi:hypothetical protein